MRFVPTVDGLETRLTLDGASVIDPGLMAGLQGSSYTGGSWSDPATVIMDGYTEDIMDGIAIAPEVNDNWSVVDPTPAQMMPTPSDPYN